MINLLPPDDKKQIRAGRINVLLLRYNILLGSGIVFLGLAIGFAYFFLMTSKQIAEDTIADNTKKEGSYAEVKTQAETFRAQLSTSKNILDGQISYAKAALVIAKLLPTGTALNALKLDETSFTTPLLLTVNIQDEASAAQLLKNFQDSPLFSNVTKGKISIGQGAYPYTMELTVSMSKEAAK